MQELKLELLCRKNGAGDSRESRVKTRSISEGDNYLTCLH
jgi:hypothetical protein